MNTALIRLDKINKPLKADNEVEGTIKDLYIAGYVRDAEINEYTAKYWDVKLHVNDYQPIIKFRFSYEDQPLFDKIIGIPDNMFPGPKHFPPRDASLLSSTISLHVDLNKKGPYKSREMV